MRNVWEGGLFVGVRNHSGRGGVTQSCTEGKGTYKKERTDSVYSVLNFVSSVVKMKYRVEGVGRSISGALFEIVE